MAVKIKISYTEDIEAQAILALLKPIIRRFKVKTSNGTPPYKHIYFTSKKGENAQN